MHNRMECNIVARDFEDKRLRIKTMENNKTLNECITITSNIRSRCKYLAWWHNRHLGIAMCRKLTLTTIRPTTQASLLERIMEYDASL